MIDQRGQRGASDDHGVVARRRKRLAASLAHEENAGRDRLSPAKGSAGGGRGTRRNYPHRRQVDAPLRLEEERKGSGLLHWFRPSPRVNASSWGKSPSKKSRTSTAALGVPRVPANWYPGNPKEGVMLQKTISAASWSFGKIFRRMNLLWFGAMLLSSPTLARECYWDGSSPICRGRCPADYDTVQVKACLNGFKVKCCEKLKSTTYEDFPAHPAPQAKAKPCPQGLVWRERFDGDTVCVLPGERDANRRKRGLSVGGATACPQGLVWREQFDGDTVCVTPLERDANRRRRGLPVH